MTSVKASPWRAMRPPVHEPQCPPLPLPESLSLPGGNELLMLDRGDADVCRLTMLLPGAELDAPSPSVAELASRMLREGSQSLHGDDFADLIESNGAWLSTSVGEHYRIVQLHSLNSRLPLVIDAVRDSVTDPRFDPDMLAVYRDKMAQTRRNDLLKVSFRAARECRRMLYGNDSLLSRSDDPEHILAVTHDEVRQLHDSHAPRGMKLVLSGRLTPAIRETVARTFSTSGNSPQCTPPHPAEAAVTLPNAPLRSDVTMEGTRQSAIRIAIPTIGREHDDYEMLRIAVTALGGYFGSRLNTGVREEQGLTYGIQAWLAGHTRFGAVGVTCQTAPQNVERVIDAVRAEILRMATGDFTSEEITRLRRYYLSTLIATFETPFSVADYHESAITASLPHDYFSQQLHALSTLTAGDLARMAREHIRPDAMIIATAGPSLPAL